LVTILFTAFYGFDCSKSTKSDPIDETFYINLTPADVAAGVGDTLAFTGSINSVEGLFAISFDLVFDTMVVVFESLSLPSNGILGQNSISFSGEIDDGVSVSLGRTQTSGNDNVSASGVLFEVDFVVVGAGTTEIQYRHIYIIDEDGTENSDLGAIEARSAAVEVG
jgi:hypothetical protein